MCKVLVHDDSPNSGLIHETNKQFMISDDTICGERLHPISTLNTPKLFVTCPECLAKLNDSQLQEQIRKAKMYMGKILKAAGDSGMKTNVSVVHSGNGTAFIDISLVRSDKPMKITTKTVL